MALKPEFRASSDKTKKIQKFKKIYYFVKSQVDPRILAFRHILERKKFSKFNTKNYLDGQFMEIWLRLGFQRKEKLFHFNDNFFFLFLRFFLQNS